jgi:hypothetical protein
VHEYTPRNTTEGHIFNQRAKIEIRKSFFGGNSGRLIHEDSIQGISEIGLTYNINKFNCCKSIPTYSNISRSASSTNLINRVTFLKNSLFCNCHP